MELLELLAYGPVLLLLQQLGPIGLNKPERSRIHPHRLSQPSCGTPIRHLRLQGSSRDPGDAER